MIDGNAQDDTFGWAILPEAGQAHQLVLALAAPLTLQPGETLTLELTQNRAGHLLGHFRIGVTTNAEALQGPLRFPPAKEIGDLLLIAADQRDAAQKEKLFEHFKSVAPETAGPRNQLAAARKARSDFEGTIPRCLVSVAASEPRTVRLLPRGNFLIETGEIMQPALPPYLVASVPECRGSSVEPPRSGELAGVAGKSAHRAGGRQPALETILWRRPFQGGG